MNYRILAAACLLALAACSRESKVEPATRARCGRPTCRRSCSSQDHGGCSA